MASFIKSTTRKVFGFRRLSNVDENFQPSQLSDISEDTLIEQNLDADEAKCSGFKYQKFTGDNGDEEDTQSFHSTGSWRRSWAKKLRHLSGPNKDEHTELSNSLPNLIIDELSEVIDDKPTMHSIDHSIDPPDEMDVDDSSQLQLPDPSKATALLPHAMVIPNSTSIKYEPLDDTDGTDHVETRPKQTTNESNRLSAVLENLPLIYVPGTKQLLEADSSPINDDDDVDDTAVLSDAAATSTSAPEPTLARTIPAFNVEPVEMEMESSVSLETPETPDSQLPPEACPLQRTSSLSSSTRALDACSFSSISSISTGTEFSSSAVAPQDSYSATNAAPLETKARSVSAVRQSPSHPAEPPSPSHPAANWSTVGQPKNASLDSGIDVRLAVKTSQKPQRRGFGFLARSLFSRSKTQTVVSETPCNVAPAAASRSGAEAAGPAGAGLPATTTSVGGTQLLPPWPRIFHRSSAGVGQPANGAGAGAQLYVEGGTGARFTGETSSVPTPASLSPSLSSVSSFRGATIGRAERKFSADQLSTCSLVSAESGCSRSRFKTATAGAGNGLVSSHHSGDVEVSSTTGLILEDRPANLPSKSREESLKHRQQYEEMVLAAKKKEQRDAKEKVRRQKELGRLEAQREADLKAWRSQILPNWKKMRNSRHTKEMIWRGIPPAVRGQVWKLSVGNDLNLTEELFLINMARAESLLSELREMTSSRQENGSVSTNASTTDEGPTQSDDGESSPCHPKARKLDIDDSKIVASTATQGSCSALNRPAAGEPGETGSDSGQLLIRAPSGSSDVHSMSSGYAGGTAALASTVGLRRSVSAVSVSAGWRQAYDSLGQLGSVDQIKLDVSRTFPQLGIFQKDGPYHDNLHSVLAAYAVYRPDIGYVQGMSFLAAILLLNLELADAFIVFANLLNKPCLLCHYRVDELAMDVYLRAFDHLLAANLPRLHQHFRHENLTSNLYLIEWILTGYSKQVNLETASRIWDMFCYEGEEFLFRCGLGILRLYEDDLVELDFILLAQFLTKLPADLDEAALFKSIQSVRMNTDALGSFSQMVARFGAQPVVSS